MCYPYGRLLALHGNFRPGIKHSSLFGLFSSGKEKSLITLTSGANVKIFLWPQFTSVHNKLECLSLGDLCNLV
jgi:hypothetical protein